MGNMGFKFFHVSIDEIVKIFPESFVYDLGEVVCVDLQPFSDSREGESFLQVKFFRFHEPGKLMAEGRGFVFLKPGPGITFLLIDIDFFLCYR
jgi:hypothetical protein